MSVRVLLAIVFTAVLLAAVTPAVENARDARTEAATTRAAEHVADAASTLVDGGEPPRGVAGPRRIVAIELPPETALVVSNGSRLVRSTVDGQTFETTPLPTPVRVRGRELRLTGRVDLQIEYERRSNGRVLVFTRGFIRESEAKKGYALTPGAAPLRARRLAVRHVVSVPSRSHRGRPHGRRVGLPWIG